MSTRKTTRRGERGLAGSSWLLLLALAVAAAAGGAWWLLSPSTTEARAGSGPPPSTAEGAERRLPATPVRATDVEGVPAVTTGAAPVTLEPPTPTGRFGPMLPVAGRTAALEVQITEGGIGGVATLRVLAGADAGRVLHTDAEGSLRAEELFPGRVRLSVATATGSACERELLLRHRRTATLALDFGDHGAVSGRVTDEHGAPLRGARVELDGEQVVTDAEGRYAVRRSVSGRSALTVRHPGYARQRRFVGAEAGAPSGASRSGLDVALQPAARLAVSVPAGPGLVGDVTLVLVPEGDPAAFAGGVLQPTFPWGAWTRACGISAWT